MLRYYLKESWNMNNNSIANERLYTRPDDSGRKEVEIVGLVTHYYSVSSVVSPLTPLYQWIKTKFILSTKNPLPFPVNKCPFSVFSKINIP